MMVEAIPGLARLQRAAEAAVTLVAAEAAVEVRWHPRRSESDVGIIC